MAYTQAELSDALANYLAAAPNATYSDIVQAASGLGISPQEVQATIATSPVVIDKITQQILEQGTTTNWSGEGKGSAQANAADMAKIIASTGATDIRQFGQITKEIPASIIGYTENGEPIESAAQTVTTYGNKVSGQEVPNTYGERQTGNAFGGTYTGKGNTAYRVETSPDGTPVFYSTGASSSDAAQWMPIVQLALAATGAGGLLGNALLGTGASQIASSALGNAILGGATTGLAGGDILKGALLGGAGGALSGYLQGGPIDASSMTSTQFNDALESQLIGEMQRSGLTNAQISQWLENASTADIASVVNALPVTGASDNLIIEAAKTPITANALTDVLSQTPTIVTTANRPEQVSTDTLNAVTSLLNNNLVTTPTVDVTATRPNNTDIPVISPIGTTPITTTPTVDVTATRPTKTDIPVITPTTTTPIVTEPTTTTPTKKDTPITTSDIIKLISVVPAIAAITKIATPTTTPPTGFDIVPIPDSFGNPPKPSVAPYSPLAPINFGDRNLLIGTQWEKFLNPNYGKVPEPVQYSQPSSLSYNDLMGILGSKQGMPSANSLSINDIISGIQNQYGQTPTRTMG